MIPLGLNLFAGVWTGAMLRGSLGRGGIHAHRSLGFGDGVPPGVKAAGASNYGGREPLVLATSLGGPSASRGPGPQLEDKGRKGTVRPGLGTGSFSFP